jgi:succinoglycan biosynthesis protein ExoW
MSSVSVVIPYYQRRAGLLAKALESVSGQTAFDRIDAVIVVDDESPRSAELDLGELNRDDRILQKLTIVSQKNAGVSRARNAGLDRVMPHVEYVAFLDPDDVWLPEHLALSLAGLDTGSDFHFSNFTQVGQQVGAFERANRHVAAEHPLLIPPAVHRYGGDMVRQITTANLIGTTSVVYRFSRARAVRFPEQFIYACEDYLMWLSLLHHCRAISFTSVVTAHCGEGVNLFSGATWGSTHLCRRLVDEINYRSYLLDSVSMQPDNYQAVRKLLLNNRRAYLGNLWSMLKRLKINVVPLVAKQVINEKRLRRLLISRV